MGLKKPCAYCGKPSDKRDREHVFPSCLYPTSKANSKVQRLTIPACNGCNNSWADDEAHFRNVLTIAGDPGTPARNELWNTTINRSFSEIDGFKRITDLLRLMEQVKIDGQVRHKIYPANDPRVIRVIKKIVKGLCYYHEIISPLPDEKIIADVLRYPIPDELLAEMIYCERDPDIVEYRYKVFGSEEDLLCVWWFRFLRTIQFIVIVDR